MFTRQLAVCLALLQLVACAATVPFDIRGVDARTTPRQAVATPDVVHGRQVLWAGVIVQGSNQQDSTQLEILAYPLRYNQRPDTSVAPLGRFIVIHPGYLETVDYAPGRTLTVLGTLEGVRYGKIGAAEYAYPVIRAPQLRLWPAARNADTKPQFHIGVGVLFH